MARHGKGGSPGPSKANELSENATGRPFTWQLTWAAMGFLHVVCPLLFFTNLTRNPYYTQIALLNIVLAFCGLLWTADLWRRGEWRLPRVSFEIPLAAFLAL